MIQAEKEDKAMSGEKMGIRIALLIVLLQTVFIYFGFSIYLVAIRNGMSFGAALLRPEPLIMAVIAIAADLIMVLRKRRRVRVA